MKGLRRLLGHRLPGGVTVALAAYFLVLQAFVAALTCGMTVPVTAGEAFVLCQPSQSLAEKPGAGQDDAHDVLAHACPCVVCQGTDFDVAAAHAPGADLGPAFTARDPVPLLSNGPSAGHPVDPARLGLAPDPRGPPALSA